MKLVDYSGHGPSTKYFKEIRGQANFALELQAKLDAAEAHISELESAGDAIIDLIDLPLIPHNQRCKIVKFDHIKRETPAQSLAKVQAETITKLIADKAVCANVDGCAWNVIYVGTAQTYVDELLGEGK